MTARIFKNGNSKAIRIPKGLLPDDINEVEIKKTENGFLIIPKKNSIDDLFKLIEENKNITKDFLNERNQPLPDEKELF